MASSISKNFSKRDRDITGILGLERAAYDLCRLSRGLDITRSSVSVALKIDGLKKKIREGNI